MFEHYQIPIQLRINAFQILQPIYPTDHLIQKRSCKLGLNEYILIDSLAHQHANKLILHRIITGNNTLRIGYNLLQGRLPKQPIQGIKGRLDDPIQKLLNNASAIKPNLLQALLINKRNNIPIPHLHPKAPVEGIIELVPPSDCDGHGVVLLEVLGFVTVEMQHVLGDAGTEFVEAALELESEWEGF